VNEVRVYLLPHTIRRLPHLGVTVAKTKVKRKNGEVAVIENGGAGGSSLLELQGARNIRTLSAKYIADLQEDWEKHGKAALAEYRERFVDRYVENYAI
jgi:hypothetical protein